MRKKRVVLALASAVFALSAFADGAPVFKKNCVPCHGADGSGNTPAGKSLGARDLRSSQVSKLSDKEIARVIAKGKGKMPSFGSLSQTDIDAVIAFVRQLQSKR